MAEILNPSQELRRLDLLEEQRKDVLMDIKWFLEEKILLRRFFEEVRGAERIRLVQVGIKDEREEKTGLLSAAIPVLMILGEGVNPKETEKVSIEREKFLWSDVLKVSGGETEPPIICLENNINGMWEIHHDGLADLVRLWRNWLTPMEKVNQKKPTEHIFVLGLALFKWENGKIQLAPFPVTLTKEKMLRVFDKDTGWLIAQEEWEARKQELIAKMTPLEVWQEDPKIFFNNLWDFIHDPKKTDGKEEMRRVNLGIAGISGEAHLSQGKILLKVYGASRIAFDRQSGKVEQAYGAVDRQNLEIYLMQSEISDGGIALICSTINPKEPKRRYAPILNQGQIYSLINLFGKLKPY